MIDLENSTFMEQVEDLSLRKRWADARDMLLLLEPADIAAVLAQLPGDRLPLLCHTGDICLFHLDNLLDFRAGLPLQAGHDFHIHMIFFR